LRFRRPLRRRRLDALPVHDENLPDVLHRHSPGALADVREQGVAPAAVFARDADLDELVHGERAVDLGQHRGGQSASADQHDRGESMGAAFQRLALRRGQRVGHAAVLIRANTAPF